MPWHDGPMDVIWALDQRERCIAAPPKPKANAVILYLSADGTLPRTAVEKWAQAGVMAAGATWAGKGANLSDDDWLDLEDAALGLDGLAATSAIIGEPGLDSLVNDLGARTGLQYFVAEPADAKVLAVLTSAAPVA